MNHKWVVVMKPFRGTEPYESDDLVDASSWPGSRLTLLIAQRYVRLATPEEVNAAEDAVSNKKVAPVPEPMRAKKTGRRAKA